jgi:hypothetical protein
VQEDEYEFGTPLEPEEADVVNSLTAEDVAAIDSALLSSTTAAWAKVAMVLAKQLKPRPGVPDDVPLEFYWSRLCGLVERGDLESRGNLRRARFSEVRRAAAH